MKKKIKDALKLKYVNLGLADEVFERVAASVETFITDEAQIPNFVDGAEGLLKQYQSTGDKARQEAAELKRQKEELEAEIAALKGKQDHSEEDGEKDLSAQITAAVTAALKPLQDEVSALKGAGAARAAFESAKNVYYENDYVKKFKDEADDAWERAVELNSATGEKMTAEELSAKALGYFNKAVSRKGVDTTKPFEADKDEKDVVPDWKSERERQDKLHNVSH